MSGYNLDSDGDVAISIRQSIFQMQHRGVTTDETYENVVATVRGFVWRQNLVNLFTYVLRKTIAPGTNAVVVGAATTAVVRPSRMGSCLTSQLCSDKSSG
ncbi:hypothetical protein PHMEG_0007947 [Phytophthora megakarya]|uniref:Uncharacterized protein n=1 Tax=Phytophthora megakarya TaxID=4795 RepID=A0A225WL98_9STRA|nr:hypothetical protein PHMEG_0007947 [Phytophthora megakarya]